MIDVCLLLEGTYPYVAGGVSTWVYQLIKEFKELTFAVVYLGPHWSSQRKLHYEIPGNVVDFREFYLFDYKILPEKSIARKQDYKRLEEFLFEIKNNNIDIFGEVYKLVGPKETRRLSLYDLTHSQEIWNIILKLYEHETQKSSFIDYFWTWRFIYLPFFSLLRVELPEAKVYHTVSTGYAGVLGSMCKLRYKRPLMLTEHGIYTKERKIEISKSDWIYSDKSSQLKVIDQNDFFREWWIQFFSYFSHLVYDKADQIITLFEGNRRMQIDEGADPAKIQIIPNAVMYKRLPPKPEEAKEANKQEYKVGFVGRVVPIKDVKTLILAFRRVFDVLRKVKFYIIGPVDEDEEYFEECKLLVETEQMQEHIAFVGKVNPEDYYKQLDVLVLTSISEAQPLVILEAQAYGVPVVATDVGACRELLFGSSPDDQLLGESGAVTPIYNPEATADAIIRILKDFKLHKKMSHTGATRVQKFYQAHDLVGKYRMLYNQFGELMTLENPIPLEVKA